MIVNALKMSMDLDELYRQWCNISKESSIERAEWTRGVTSGIMLATKMVHHYTREKVA